MPQDAGNNLNPITMTTKSKVLISFSGYTDGNLETKALSIVQCLTGNPFFPDPIPSIAEIMAVLANYSAALVDAKMLDRTKVAEKNKYRKELELNLGQLGTFINYVANGDIAMLTSSGYTVSKVPAPAVLTNPGNVTLTDGITSGAMVSSVKAPGAAKGYVHEITTDPLADDSNWKSVHTSRSRYTFTNLEPGKKYWVRVAAIGTNEQIAYSNNASRFAQ